MTEKEKCLRGELYNPNYDEELQAEMLAAADKCHQYNSLAPSNLRERDRK